LLFLLDDVSGALSRGSIGFAATILSPRSLRCARQHGTLVTSRFLFDVAPFHRAQLAKMLPIVFSLTQDKSWRVRYMVADKFCEVSRFSVPFGLSRDPSRCCSKFSLLAASLS
jgi:hypothetical protein